MIDVVLKRFERPDETRILTKGKFEIVTLWRAHHRASELQEPGWKWSQHVGPTVGASAMLCRARRLGLDGTATAAFDDGTVVELRAGELFHIPAVPHDSWVVGDVPYVSLHFLGADAYARHR